MSRSLLATFMILAPNLFLLGQDRVSMSAPQLAVTPEELRLTAHFSHFVRGSYYRLGVGTTGEKINNLKMDLFKGRTVLDKELVSFQQGFAQSWFEVDQLFVEGFNFLRAEVPRAGETLTLKVTLPRAEAQRLGRLFVIIAKRYTLDRWYLEDGIELNPSDW